MDEDKTLKANPGNNDLTGLEILTPGNLNTCPPHTCITACLSKRLRIGLMYKATSGANSLDVSTGPGPT